MISLNSLDYLLPILSKKSPARILQAEMISLKKVVASILQEINQRKNLEHNLLYELEKRIMHLHTEIFKTDIPYFIGIPRQSISIEKSIDKVERQKIKTQEQSARDILELNKQLWHYWLLFQKKQAQQYFLQ